MSQNIYLKLFLPKNKNLYLSSYKSLLLEPDDL